MHKVLKNRESMRAAARKYVKDGTLLDEDGRELTMKLWDELRPAAQETILVRRLVAHWESMGPDQRREALAAMPNECHVCDDLSVLDGGQARSIAPDAGTGFTRRVCKECVELIEARLKERPAGGDAGTGAGPSEHAQTAAYLRQARELRRKANVTVRTRDDWPWQPRKGDPVRIRGLDGTRRHLNGETGQLGLADDDEFEVALDSSGECERFERENLSLDSEYHFEGLEPSLRISELRRRVHWRLKHLPLARGCPPEPRVVLSLAGATLDHTGTRRLRDYGMRGDVVVEMMLLPPGADADAEARPSKCPASSQSLKEALDVAGKLRGSDVEDMVSLDAKLAALAAACSI